MYSIIIVVVDVVLAMFAPQSLAWPRLAFTYTPLCPLTVVVKDDNGQD